MDAFDEKIKRHLEKVAEAQMNADDGALTLTDLKELNMSLGVTEDEWEKLMNKAKECIVLAKNHLQYRNFKDAIESVDQALALNPFIKEGNGVKAKASLMLWLEVGEEGHRINAENFAKEALKEEPQNTLALQVLQTLRAKGRSEEKESKLNKKGLYIIGGLVFIIAIGLGFFFMQSGGGTKNRLIDAEESVNSAYAQLQNVYQRKTDLVPQLLDLFVNNPSDINNEIEKLQTELKENLSIEEREIKQKELSEMLSKLTKQGNFGGDSNALETLLIQLEGAENRISAERKNYNNAVKTYNLLVKKEGIGYPEFEIKPYLNGN